MTPTTALRRALRAGLCTGVAIAVVLAAGLARAQAPAPPVNAVAVILMDLQTGKVIYEKNAEDERAPASLVKMMTLYLAYQDLRAGKVRLNDQVEISPAVTRTPRFRMGLQAGRPVSFDILMAGTAVASANDAAAALAEYLEGDEDRFVRRMNEEARRIGLAHTTFGNPHGLPDPRNRTTAHDMASLAETLLRDFPESREFLGDTQFRWGGRIFQRRINLFRDPGGVTALKTGFTLDAGYNLTVAASRPGARLLCVVLGAETRGLSFLDAGKLLKYGFGDSIGTAQRKERFRWKGPGRSAPAVKRR